MTRLNRNKDEIAADQADKSAGTKHKLSDPVRKKQPNDDLGEMTPEQEVLLLHVLE
jgi:hypothetical protein